MEVTVFCNLNKWHPIISALFYSLEAKSLVPAHTGREGVTHGHEYKDTGIIGNMAKTAYYRNKIPGKYHQSLLS